MIKGVAYIRHDPGTNFEKSKILLKKLLADYCQKEKIQIIRGWEDINDADTVFGADGWCDMEEYIYNHQDEIDVIVVPTVDTLLENNIHAIMEKTEFMDSMNIKILIASEHKLTFLK